MTKCTPMSPAPSLTIGEVEPFGRLCSPQPHGVDGGVVVAWDGVVVGHGQHLLAVLPSIGTNMAVPLDGDGVLWPAQLPAVAKLEPLIWLLHLEGEGGMEERGRVSEGGGGERRRRGARGEDGREGRWRGGRGEDGRGMEGEGRERRGWEGDGGRGGGWREGRGMEGGEGDGGRGGGWREGRERRGWEMEGEGGRGEDGRGMEGEGRRMQESSRMRSNTFSREICGKVQS